MLNAKIKSRRLGYLKLLGKYISENPSLRTRLFNKRFEDYALLFESSFSRLTEQSGLIISNNGKSAEPYVQMAESLAFLTRSEKEYLIDNEFRSYALRLALFKESNIFILSQDDIQFFLSRLLLSDGEIIKPLLLTIINQDEQDNAISVRRKFSTLLISLNSQISIEAKMAINRTGRSKFYLDELFHPRLHWLLDLKLVCMNTDGKIVLTESGHKTCSELGLKQ